MLELDRIWLPLNETTQEISRICRELEKIVRSQAPFVNAKICESVSPPTDRQLVLLAKEMIRERGLRMKYFTDLEFGEPVWDILLDLYISHHSKRRISISSACIAANVPATTALRYISNLTSQGVIFRIADASDARRVFIKLSDEMERSIRSYLRLVYEQRYACLEDDAGLNLHEHQRQIYP
jgi:DNA-binding MarR family transcriptional regulator